MDISRYAAYPQLSDVAVAPDGQRACYVSDQDGAAGLYLTPLSGPAPARLAPDLVEVTGLRWRPDGARVVVTVDADGRENGQLAEVDVATGEVHWLTTVPKVRHEIGTPYASASQPYSPDSSRLAYSSNARDVTAFDIIVRDLRTGDERTLLVADDRYYPISWSPDGRQLLIHRLHQNLDHDLFLATVDTGEVVQLTPADGEAKYLPAGWTPDGTGIYVVTTQGRDLLGLARIDLADPAEPHYLVTPDADITAATVSSDGERLVWTVNAGGYGDLWVGAADGTGARQVTGLPRGLVAAELGYDGMSLRHTADDHLVVILAQPTRPAEVAVVDLAENASNRVRLLTDCGASTPDPSSLVEPTVVTFPSTGPVDGRPLELHALLYRPAGASADAPVPVLVSIHGGPEAQEFPAYEPIYQYLLGRGIAVLAPNIRGSSGYGQAYQKLIYRDWGRGDLADFAGIVEYLRGLDWVDSERLGVFGASYGGFATLLCLVRLPDAWRVGVDMMGPSSLLTDVDTVPPYWRRRMYAWCGDPAVDPADEQMLRERSPITHVDQITAPLLVIHGSNDVRVGPGESSRLVARLQELGRPVTYLPIEDLGHGYGDLDTRTALIKSVTDFLVDHLTPVGPS